MSKRVLVLYTGGTIGMVPSEQGYVPQAGFEARLRQHLNDPRLPDFDLIEFEQPLDSASLVPEDWTRIGQLLQQHWDAYAGFVVLHGTDTLAYTASALSFMLAQQDKPVVLTGSQIPLSQLRNDAADNLVTALLLAAHPGLAEVCVCFNGRILRGNRSRKVNSTGLDAFDSPNYPHLGRAGIDLELKERLLLPAESARFELAPCRSGAVAMLGLFPGIQADMLRRFCAEPGLRGLVLTTYGVGNPPASDPALLQVLADAIAQGLTVVNLSQCHQGAVSQGAYATGALLNDIGVLAGADLTPEAAFAKLHHLVARHAEAARVREGMQSAQRGECRLAQESSA